MRRVILVCMALVAALGTAFLVRAWSQAQNRPIVQQEQVAERSDPSAQVLVANRNLPAGTIVHTDDLRWQVWPEDGLAESYVSIDDGTPEDFLGAVVRQGVGEGDPITATRVVRQGERGFLAAILQPGMRAVSVPVSAQTGVSGLLFPGDRVDLILTHAIDKDDRQGNMPRRASETVLRDVRLLAVDQRTNDQESLPGVAKTVTLEVSPKQAEAISMLTDMGRLSLSLRSLALDEDLEPGKGRVAKLRKNSFTLDNQVSALLKPAASISKTKEHHVSVVRGSEVEALVFGDGQVKSRTQAKASAPEPASTAAN